MVKIGDEIITISPLWHNGEDVGDRLGKVISTEGHIIVNLHNYPDNPIKCFRNEVHRLDAEDGVIVDDYGYDEDFYMYDLFNLFDVTD